MDQFSVLNNYPYTRTISQKLIPRKLIPQKLIQQKLIPQKLITQKLIQQSGPWYTYRNEKVMGMNGVKKFFSENPQEFLSLQNELTA